MAITVTPTVTDDEIELSWGLGSCSTFSYYEITVYEGVFPSTTVYFNNTQTQDSYTLTSVPNGDYYAVIDAYDSGLSLCDTGNSGTINVNYTPAPTGDYLSLLFDDIANANALVGDASDVDDWNTFFDLPTYGTPFTAVTVVDDEVRLFGGEDIELKNYLFYQNDNILEIVDDAECIISANTLSFDSCTSLTLINLPALITATTSTFFGCVSLTTINLPELTSTGEGCFEQCTSLETISLPKIIDIGSYCFTDCTSLTTISIPLCTNLGGTVGNNNVFLGITGNNITLTVPQALMVCNSGDPDGDIQDLQANNTVTIITPSTSGVKYQVVGTSDIYGKVTVNINQAFYVGETTTFEGAGRTWVNLSIGQGGNDISQAILPSFCSVQFYVDQDFAVLELAQDPPFSYTVEVLDDDDNTIWTGTLLPEEYQEDYTNTPYIVTITASDGLEELKSIEYPITIGGKASLWEHLTTALSYTGQSIPFFESVNIYDVEMDDDPADSPFLQAEVTYESFLKLTEKPNCYDVIVAILKPFYSRIYQYRGWRIENIYGKKTSYVERYYNASGVYVSQVTVNPVVELDNDPSDFKAFLGKSGRLDFHPALNSTSVYFNTAQVVNPNGPGGWSLNSDWVDDNTLTDWTTENDLTISKLPFGYNGSETILRIQGKQDTLADDLHIKSGVYTIDSADFQNFTFRFDYWMNYPTLVIFGTKPILYLQVELTDSLSNKWYFKNGNWTLIKADGWIRIDAPGRQVWRSFENNINSLPNITGSADIRFYVYQLVKTGSADQVEVRLTNWATNIQVEELYTDLILEEKAGQNILSTYKGPSFQHFISDGEVVNLAGVMDVNGVLTSEWNRRGETDELNIRRLFMMQWLTMHQGQASKLSGSLYQKGEKVTPMSVLKDKDAVATRKYVMTGWEFNLGNGIGSIKYHEIFEDEVTPFYLVDFITSIPPSAYLVPDYSIPIGVPGLSPGVSPGGSGFNVPNFTFPAFNGDLRGEPSANELTPSAIFGKPRLDLTGLTADDIVVGAVKDSPNQENMTNLTLSDIKPLVSTPVTIGTPANGLSINPTTQVLTIGLASTSATGALSSTDWNTFYGKQGAITLTTTGSSGAATLVGTTLNIPNYGSALSGYVPYTGATANVNLGAFDLTADVITGATGSFSSSGSSNTFGITHSSGSGIALNITKGGSGEGLYINKTSGSGNAATIIGTLNATTLVKSGGTSSQFLKANGDVDSNSYYLASNPSGFTSNVGTVTSVGLSSSTSGVTIGSTPITSSGTITLSIATASGSQNGLLSSTDWTTFYNKSNLALGETSTTAYRGDRGKIAYDYSQVGHLPLAGGTLTGSLQGTSSAFSGNVTWSGSQSGNPRAVAIGWSGNEYGQIGYGISFTGTGGVHNYAINDIVSRVEFYNGINVYAANAGTVGTAISWTTVLQARRDVFTYLGNTILHSGNATLQTITDVGNTTTNQINVARLSISGDTNWFSMRSTVASASYGTFFRYDGVSGAYIGFNAGGIEGGGDGTTFGIRSDADLILMSGGSRRITVNSTGNVLIGTTTDLGGTLKLQVAGNVALRASTTSSAPTQIPVFTADPSSTTRELVTRTPAQFRNDIGAGFRVSNGIYIANGAYVAHAGTGGTSYFPLSILPYTYYNVRPAASGDFHTWSIKGEVSFTSAYPVFVFITGSDDSNSVNFLGVSSGDYRFEIDVCTVTASNTRLKVTLTVKLFNDTNVWQRITTFDRTIGNVATTPLDAMVNCLFSSSNAGNLITVYDLRVVESPYTLSDNSING